MGSDTPYSLTFLRRAVGIFSQGVQTLSMANEISDLSAAERPEPPFIIIGPQPPERPVILAVPHAGRAYSAALLADAAVPLSVLRRLEDRLADQLITHAVAAGFTVVLAQAPRAMIDLNRADHDLDPAGLAGVRFGLRPSRRARAGLGLVPTRLAPEGALWREPLPLAVLDDRIATIYHPYHAAIAGLLAKARAQWGAAALLDIHSMPSPTEPLDLVIGDRYGLTATGEFVDHLLAVAGGRGFVAARNHPYAGAFAIEHHAHRRSGSQAVQIEVDRGLYLDAYNQIDPAGCASASALVRAMAQAADAWLQAGRAPVAVAAE